MLHVRDAHRADASALADVHVRSWQEGYRGLLAQDFLDAMRPQDWVDRFSYDSTDGICTLVAVDGEAIRGHVTVGPSRDADSADSGEVWAIYVDPRSWGAGVGRALIDAACDRLAAAGHARAFLWVMASNSRARRFYESAGWRTDGRARSIPIGGRAADEVSYAIALSQRRI